MRVRLILVLVLFLLYACKDTSKTEKPIAVNELIGEWNNIYMKVDTRTKNNTDSSEVLEVNKGNWEDKLKIRPIRTYFRVDSTWNSAHYNLHDSLVYNPSGKWWMEGDSLIMQQLFPSPDKTSYKLTMSADTALFECMYDWDMDGKKDDYYFGRQVKRK